MLQCKIAAFLAVLALPIPALASGKSTRIVEIVRMGPSAAPEVQEQEDSSPASGFHLLDLARIRTGEVMLQSFGALAANRDDMTRRGALPPYSDIAVPEWMRKPLLSAWPAGRDFLPDCTAVPYRPVGFLSFDVESRRRAAYTAMSAAACDAGIPVGLFDALILTESAYNPSVVSPKQAYGLAQLMPGTAGDLGVNRYDPIQNLRGGARYLRAQLDRFGKVHLALAAYNAGPGRVKGGRIPPIAETQNYVRNVLDKWARLAGHHQVVEIGDFARSPPVSTNHVKPVRAASVQIF